MLHIILVLVYVIEAHFNACIPLLYPLYVLLLNKYLLYCVPFKCVKAHLLKQVYETVYSCKLINPSL